MREIKYRAYLKEEGRIVDVIDIHLTAEMIGVLNDDGSDVTLYNFEDIELMQYTGLKDFEGNEAYHKYIVTIDGESELALIEWDEREACFYLKKVRGYGPERRNILALQFSKIIGNIYEHPHLLKEPTHETNI